MKTWQRYKTDERYRRNIEIRRKVMEAIRDFFALEGFLEIETPTLVASPDLSPNLDFMKTEVINPLGGKGDAYLITSPEFSMKKMLAAGMGKIFFLGKVFRNNEPFGEGTGEQATHNPEFTMLEWYRAGVDYTKLMDDTEKLVKHCAEAVYGQWTMDNGQCDDKSDGTWSMVHGPWLRLSVKEAFAQIGLNLDELLTRDTMAKAAADRGHAVSPNDTFDDCFFKIFLTEIEPKLGVERPTIIYDYPIQMAALARPKPEDPRYAERFEAYADGLELCNCFSELVNPDEQRSRFEKELEERREQGKCVPPLDDDLLAALGEIKSAAGNALGVDRLVMLLAGAKSIDDVLLFPASELFH